MEAITNPRQQPAPRLSGGYFKYLARIEFKFDDIVHTEFGKATGLQGEIPFLHSPQVFRDCVQELKENPAMVSDIAWEMVRKYRDFWEDLTDEEIYAQFEERVRTVLVGLAGVGLEDDLQRRNFMVQFIVLAAVADSFADPMIGSEAFDEDGVPTSNQTGFQFLELGEQFGTKLPSVDLLPSALVALERGKRLYNQVREELLALISDFDERYGDFLGPGLVTSITSHFILHDMKRDKNGPKFTQETMNDLWQEIAANLMSIHMIHIFKSIRLPPRVVRSKLLEILLKRAGDIMMLTNAIIGLHRDIRLHQIDGPITCAVMYEGVPLLQAWDTAIHRLRSQYHDYRTAALRLVQVFKEEESELKRYIDVIDAFIDGSLFIYTVSERYGNQHQLRVVE